MSQDVWSRRRYLAAAGLTGSSLIAGCPDTSSNEVEGEGNRPTDTAEDSQSSTEESQQTDQSETETATPEPSGEASLDITNEELVVEEGDYSTDVYVSATVENTGDAASGSIELTANW
ncbi:hypothetical protein [Haloprofundus salilacus]|uniref:hypothetical protein n=1 Tax=Haloprofundus salilacus TaxID=2876190 RepID=UPI001CCE45AF|nr:hypothetical protein [Haloprofundus salilacus]